MKLDTIHKLQVYVDMLVDMGFGSAKPVLDRRGYEHGSDPIEFSTPCEGERVSEDGKTVYLSARRVEF